MPETSLPPPKSGSGQFILAAIVMLVLMGGLIVWKVKAGSETPKARVQPPPPPAATQVAFEEPPPPPPPAPVDSAPKEEPKPGIKRVGGPAPSCSGECTGEATAALRSALRAKAGQAQGCYERALRQNSTLQGRLQVGVRVGPAGQVCSANVISNALGDPGIAGCVLQMFRAGTFPPPEKGCVDTQVPLNFQPKT